MQNVHYINLTPHVVRLNDGREFPPSGMVARVATQYGPFVGDIATVTFGEILELPVIDIDAPSGMPQCSGVTYIVSALVAQAAGRADVVSPATNHPNAVRRDGQVFSVPGFVRATPSA